MANQQYEEGYYNEEAKLRFLSEQQFDESASAYKAYSRILSRAKTIEGQLGKDLYNFDQVDIEQLISHLAPKSNKSVQHALSIIQGYIRWAINAHLRHDDINPLDDLMGTQYQMKLVDTSKRTLFTVHDVFEIVDRLVNFQDKVVVIAPFEGVGGKNMSELLNLKRTDIDEKSHILHLTDEDGSKRNLIVSERLINILIKAHEEDTYFKSNGNPPDTLRSSDKIRLVDSPFVLKHSVTNDQSSTGKTEAYTINRRLRVVIDFFDMDYLTIGSLRNSGMLFEGYKAYREHGEIRQEDYWDIAAKFNTANKDKYSYSYLKRNFLNEETVREVYRNVEF